MPSDIVRYVRTTGGNVTGGTGETPNASGADRAFTTITSALEWAAGLYSDLVTADVRLVLRLVGPVSHTGVAWQSFTTDDTRYLLITHHDNPHNGTYDPEFDGLQYVNSTMTTSAPPYKIQMDGIVTNYVGTGVTFGAVASSTSSMNLHFNRCIFRRNPSIVDESTEGGWAFYGSAVGAVQILICTSCLFLGPWRYIMRAGFTNNASTRFVMYNATAIDCFGGVETTASTTAGRVFVKNVRVQRRAGSSLSCFNLLGSAETEANISDDASSPQVALRNITGTFVNSAGGNYTPTGADPGIGAGANLSADPQRPFTTDLRNGTITTWMVGALAPIASIIANSLLFTTQPTNTPVGSTMAPFTVSAVDSTQGNAVDTSVTDIITIADVSDNYNGTKTRAAVAGVATFDDIVPRKILADTTLSAVHVVFPSEESETFSVTTPAASNPISLETEPMSSLILRNATDAAKRIVRFNVYNTDGSAWSGNTLNVKPLLNGSPIAADVVRISGALHAAQLSQVESNTTDPAVNITLPAAGERRFASAVGIVTPNDWTLDAPDVQNIVSASRDDAIDLFGNLINGEGSVTVKNSDGDDVIITVTRAPRNAIATSTTV